MSWAMTKSYIRENPLLTDYCKSKLENTNFASKLDILKMYYCNIIKTVVHSDLVGGYPKTGFLRQQVLKSLFVQPVLISETVSKSIHVQKQCSQCEQVYATNPYAVMNVQSFPSFSSCFLCPTHQNDLCHQIYQALFSGWQLYINKITECRSLVPSQGVSLCGSGTLPSQSSTCTAPLFRQVKQAVIMLC